MNINDKEISEMGKEDFMRFVRREVLEYPDSSSKVVFINTSYWFVRGFSIGRINPSL